MRRSFFVGYEPQRLAGLSPGGGAGTVVIPNSLTGNAILRNTPQGSASFGSKHSLSGTEYSLALIIYCAGRTSLTIEKSPTVAISTRSHPSFISPARDAAMTLGISMTVPTGCPLQPQLQAQGLQGLQGLHGIHEMSTTFRSSTIGSTASTTAPGAFDAPVQSSVCAQKPAPGVLRNTAAPVSPP